MTAALPARDEAPGSRTCVACGSPELVISERVTKAALAAAWRREDDAIGAGNAGERRAAAIQACLPLEVAFERCASCGLEMALPPCVWSADDYPRDQSYPLRWEFARGLDDLGAAPRDLLEIGCGEGHFLIKAGERGHRSVGIDFSDTVVARARARGLRVFCGGFDELARHLGADQRFDAVALFHVIEHVADPHDLFASLTRWTRPGARLLISCPGPRRFTRLIPEQQAGASDFWDYPPTHVLRWTLPALRALVERHGWRVETALEEPFSWVAAGSHIGIVRAIYRGDMDKPLRRRRDIARGWWRLLTSPSRRAGVSIYLCAVRHSGVAS
jgi:SAM-dependent methyltransferase